MTRSLRRTAARHRSTRVDDVLQPDVRRRAVDVHGEALGRGTRSHASSAGATALIAMRRFGGQPIHLVERFFPSIMPYVEVEQLPAQSRPVGQPRLTRAQLYSRLEKYGLQ